MPPPGDSAQPRLATGCRWGADKEKENKPSSKPERTILYPEGALRLRDTGLLILESCDGKRTFGEIITELQAKFADADPEKIRADIGLFLDQLRQRRIVDY